MLGLAFLAVMGASYPAGPYTLVIPDSWKVELQGEGGGTSILLAVSPKGDTVAVSHAEIPGFGLLGGFVKEDTYMDTYANGKPPEGCQKPPEKVEVNGHKVLFYTCEKGAITAVCAPDMKAILTLVAHGPSPKEAILEILRGSL